MKYTLIIIAVALIGLIGYGLVSRDSQSTVTDLESLEVSIAKTTLTPSRPAEINGTVVTAEGNVLVVANEVGKELLTEEEKEAKKAAMQNMTQEERQAARQQELEGIETQDIEIIIPVGIPILKGTGDASGENTHAEISELAKGSYVSIWVTDENTPEFVKVKGIGQ